jgi:hypothetical protein
LSAAAAPTTATSTGNNSLGNNTLANSLVAKPGKSNATVADLQKVNTTIASQEHLNVTAPKLLKPALFGSTVELRKPAQKKPSGNKGTNPSADKPLSKPADSPADKSLGGKPGPVDKPVNKPADKPANKPADKPAGQPSKPTESLPTHPADQPTNKAADRPVGDKPLPRPAADIVLTSPAGKPADQPMIKPMDTSSVNKFKPAAGSVVDKPAGGSWVNSREKVSFKPADHPANASLSLEKSADQAINKTSDIPVVEKPMDNTLSGPSTIKLSGVPLGQPARNGSSEASGNLMGNFAGQPIDKPLTGNSTGKPLIVGKPGDGAFMGNPTSGSSGALLGTSESVAKPAHNAPADKPADKRQVMYSVVLLVTLPADTVGWK